MYVRKHGVVKWTRNDIIAGNGRERFIVELQAWREEIEVKLRNEVGESYTWTVTMTKAKDGIYRDSLGFSDFKNFDGVRFS